MNLQRHRPFHVFFVFALTVGGLSFGCGGEPDSEDAVVASEAPATSRRRPPHPPAPTPPPPPAPTPPPSPPAGSATCPENDGTCASFGQSRLVCTNSGGQYACTAPAGANICANGHVCPQGTACGDLYMCPSEGGSCFLGCYHGGPVTASDGVVGAACEAVDAHGVTHVCNRPRSAGAGLSPVSIAAPERYWADHGFVLLEAPMRAPTNSEHTDHMQVWIPTHPTRRCGYAKTTS